ncbi:hypothetical protein [Paenibacillus pini]|uniref:hypothetical protein n=1 Tax=Paenibacillus pini TaxID=669461 RepID=UPI00056675AB|nr:hypothetical protein [Paenibacillus pini]
MFDNNIELLNSYSDDIIFIKDSRKAYLTHPLVRGKSVKMWFDSFCTRTEIESKTILIIEEFELGT